MFTILTITVDKKTLRGWNKPTGYIDGDDRPVYGEFDNYLTVMVKPSMTLEGDGFVKVCLYKDGKEVVSTYPDFLFDPICLEYNGEEYHIKLEKECKEKKTRAKMHGGLFLKEDLENVEKRSTSDAHKNQRYYQ